MRTSIESFLKKNPSKQQSDAIRIKITSDGTNIGRVTSLLNFAFVIVDDEEYARGVKGVNIFGLSECEEKYEQMKHLFAHLDQQILSNQVIEVCGKTFELDFYFGADMKMIDNVYGLVGPKSIWPCFVCHASIKKGYECELGEKRTFELQQTYYTCQQHMGYRNPSLLRSIPFHRIIIDPLHQKLCVIGKFINLLVTEFIELDSFNCIGKFELGKHKHLTAWFKFLTVKCQIRKKIISCNTDLNAMVTTEFNSNEMDKITSLIDLENDFGDIDGYSVEDKGIKQKLFKDFYLITSTYKTASVDELEKSTSEWYATFKSSTWVEYETPYIHLFGRHTHEFAREIGDISLFTQQGRT